MENTLHDAVEKQIGNLVLQVLQKDDIIKVLSTEVERLKAKYEPAVEEPKKAGKDAKL